jgi:chaperonin GroES
MKLKPLFDRVVLKPIKTETKTSGGIILADTNGEKPSEGLVVSVGNGQTGENKKQEMQVKVNDKVLFSKYGGIAFKQEGEEYIIIRQNDILGVWE